MASSKRGTTATKKVKKVKTAAAMKKKVSGKPTAGAVKKVKTVKPVAAKKTTAVTRVILWDKPPKGTLTSRGADNNGWIKQTKKDEIVIRPSAKYALEKFGLGKIKPTLGKPAASLQYAKYCRKWWTLQVTTIKTTKVPRWISPKDVMPALPKPAKIVHA